MDVLTTEVAFTDVAITDVTFSDVLVPKDVFIDATITKVWFNDMSIVDVLITKVVVNWALWLVSSDAGSSSFNRSLNRVDFLAVCTW